MITIQDRIKELVIIYKTLREVSRQTGVDVAYLYRLRTALKTNPSDEVLRKLGLRKPHETLFETIDG